jgi:hypothetical protein
MSKKYGLAMINFYRVPIRNEKKSMMSNDYVSIYTF